MPLASLVRDEGVLVASSCPVDRTPPQLPSGLARRFRFWTTRGGRRVVMSVYAPGEVPAYAQAVVLVVAQGRPVWVAAVETQAQLDLLRVAFSGCADEFHLHLLATDPAARAALAAELSALLPIAGLSPV
jgi:hypothetical protein